MAQLYGSAATTLAVDFLAEQRATGRAQDRAGRAVATGVDRTADQGAADAADDQAGRAVRLAAIGPAVAAAPFLVAIIFAGLCAVAGNRHRNRDGEGKGGYRQHRFTHEYLLL